MTSPTGSGSARDGAHVGGDACDLLRRQAQAVERRVGEAGVAGALDVAARSRRGFRPGARSARRRCSPAPRFSRRREAGQLAGRGLGGLRLGEQSVGVVHSVITELLEQRSRHGRRLKCLGSRSVARRLEP